MKDLDAQGRATIHYTDGCLAVRLQAGLGELQPPLAFC